MALYQLIHTVLYQLQATDTCLQQEARSVSVADILHPLLLPLQIRDLDNCLKIKSCLPSCYVHQIICTLHCHRPLVRYWEKMMSSLSLAPWKVRGKQVTGSLVTSSTFTCSTRKAVARSCLFLINHRGSSRGWEFWKRELLLHLRFCFKQLDKEIIYYVIYKASCKAHQTESVELWKASRNENGNFGLFYTWARLMRGLMEESVSRSLTGRTSAHASSGWFAGAHALPTLCNPVACCECRDAGWEHWPSSQGGRAQPLNASFKRVKTHTSPYDVLELNRVKPSAQM